MSYLETEAKARQEVYLKIITDLNKKHLQGGRFLYHCGPLGFARIYWRGSEWAVEWFEVMNAPPSGKEGLK